MKGIIFLLVLIILAGVLGIIYLVYYNKMQYLNSKMEQALLKIKNALEEKYDLIIKANNLIKENIEDKKDYLKEYTNINIDKISHFDLDKKLIEAVELIQNLQGDYKALEDNKGLKEIMVELKKVEEKLTAAKSYFNKNTTSFNECIRVFPSSLVAKIKHYKISALFSTKEIEENL